MQQLKDIFSSINVRKVFLVMGRSSYSRSGAEEGLDPVLSQYETVRFCDFSVNPKIEEVKEGIKLFNKNNPDLVVAVGGGSVIDMAKSINILSVQDGSPEDYTRGESTIIQRGRPLVAIPTTAGSGSEATQFAVVYVSQEKYSLDHKYILPNHVILKPELTLTLPPQITAATGMDALSQAIESYWSVNSTVESRSFARKAVPVILKNLPLAYKYPSNLKYRTEMMMASNLAGRAINITRTTAPHALSYILTSNFGISHGHAVGIYLGDVLVLNSGADSHNTVDKRGYKYVRNTLEEICGLLDVNSPKNAKYKIKDLMYNIGLETRLSKLGVKKKSINLIADSINFQRLKNNPVQINRKDLASLLDLIY